jgi:hypothetical protein
MGGCPYIFLEYSVDSHVALLAALFQLQKRVSKCGNEGVLCLFVSCLYSVVRFGFLLFVPLLPFKEGLGVVAFDSHQS